MTEIKVTFKDGREPMICPEDNLHNVRRIFATEISNIEYVGDPHPEMVLINIDNPKNITEENKEKEELEISIEEKKEEPIPVVEPIHIEEKEEGEFDVTEEEEKDQVFEPLEDELSEEELFNQLNQTLKPAVERQPKKIKSGANKKRKTQTA